MNRLSEMKWKASYSPEVKTVKAVIIPEDIKEKMANVTTRDIYLWGRKNGVIKRLPRKTKKHLYYGKSMRYETKATIACVMLWNEYYEQTYQN